MKFVAYQVTQLFPKYDIKTQVFAMFKSPQIVKYLVFIESQLFKQLLVG